MFRLAMWRHELLKLAMWGMGMEMGDGEEDCIIESTFWPGGLLTAAPRSGSLSLSLFLV